MYIVIELTTLSDCIRDVTVSVIAVDRGRVKPETM